MRFACIEAIAVTGIFMVYITTRPRIPKWKSSRITGVNAGKARIRESDGSPFFDRFSRIFGRFVRMPAGSAAARAAIMYHDGVSGPETIGFVQTVNRNIE